MFSRIAIVLVQTAMILGLAEAAASVVEQLHPRNTDIAFDYAPYRMLKMTSAPWPLNRDGFRARELETYRGHFLIEFLGGSVCLGVGTNPGLTVPERLQFALDRHGLSRAQVLNLCQGGATSAQEFAIFVHYGLPLQPQAVLSFDGANDLLHPRPVGTDDAPNLPYRDREMRAAFDLHHSILAHSAMVRLAARFAQRRPQDPAAAPPVASEAVLGSYQYMLELTRQLAGSSGAYHAVILQPTLHYRKPWSTEEKQMWQERDPRYGAAVSEAAAHIYAAAEGSLSGWAADNNASLFDLTGAFEQTNETIYSDSVHFSGDRGYATLFAELEKQGLVDEIEMRYREWERRERSSWNAQDEPATRALQKDSSLKQAAVKTASLKHSTPWAQRQAQ